MACTLVLATTLKSDDLSQRKSGNDGSRHRALKVYYTPATLAAALAGCAVPGHAATRATGAFFVVGHAATPAG